MAEEKAYKVVQCKAVLLDIEGTTTSISFVKVIDEGYTTGYFTQIYFILAILGFINLISFIYSLYLPLFFPNCIGKSLWVPHLLVVTQIIS